MLYARHGIDRDHTVHKARARVGVFGMVLDVLLGGIEGLVLAGFAREEDQTGLVGLEAGDVESEGFLRGGLAARVDGDADCGGELAWDAGFLLFCTGQLLDVWLYEICGVFGRTGRDVCVDVIFRTFSSINVNPRPARTRRLYLTVGQRTTGRSLSTGLGATLAAFDRRAARLRDLRPGWSK